MIGTASFLSGCFHFWKEKDIFHMLICMEQAPISKVWLRAACKMAAKVKSQPLRHKNSLTAPFRSVKAEEPEDRVAEGKTSHTAWPTAWPSDSVRV